MFRIEALVSEPDGEFNNEALAHNYLKLSFDSLNGDVNFHNSDLLRSGFRVLSVKSRPIEESEWLNNESLDAQGNQPVVDDKQVIP